MNRVAWLVLVLGVTGCVSAESASAEEPTDAGAAADVADADPGPCGEGFDGAAPAGFCNCAAECPQKTPCDGYDVCRDDHTCGGDPRPDQCVDGG